jgi:hypothetical protein
VDSDGLARHRHHSESPRRGRRIDRDALVAALQKLDSDGSSPSP